MDLQKEFASYIKTENLFQPNDRLLIAVSGGIDSVVLCDLCKESGYDFAIAHCNFQLRGEESDGDEKFVKELAAKYAVALYVKEFDTEKYAAENKLSIQVAARELRYAWFSQLINQPTNKPINQQTNQPINYLLTAHHANDNIETLLMNFFKGTGIAGLQGIMPKSGESDRVIRPLLFAKKEALLQYAKGRNLEFREDSSNASDKYTRNYFRNQLIPALQEVYPKVEDNLLENVHRFNEVHILYRRSVDAIKKKLITKKGNEIHIPVLKLLKTAALHTIVYEIIKEHGFTASQVDEVVKLLKRESGKYVASQTHRALINRNWLIISAINSTGNAHFLIEQEDDKIIFFDHKLSLEKLSVPVKIDANAAVAQLDLQAIKFPLLLRKWKQGDYFYPLGMKKKKKLSRFFIDQKLSLLEKENTWVIEMNKKIIWVVGRRIDDRFKITGKTTEILKISLSMA